MAKSKSVSVFFCKECGYESSKWMGQCPSCKAWNSFTEEIVVKSTGNSANKEQGISGGNISPVSLTQITSSAEERKSTEIEEFDRVLGGGIVPGSLTLIGGDPGIGKSTLLLQVCQKLSLKKCSVLYISGEESLHQIKMRAVRLGDFTDSLTLLCETNLTQIEQIIKKNKPEVVIIDSIQTMYDENTTAAPGSVSQVRESTAVLMRIAKTCGISIFFLETTI